ncbi:hypothetical protein ACWDAZ_36615, partial [Streptomyces sp. NPDC001215]
LTAAFTAVLRATASCTRSSGAPEQAVAVELDTRAPRQGDRPDDDALWSEYARKREHLERLGITVVHITPKKLRDAPEQQATVVRTALMASADRDPAAYVIVLPR